MPCKFQFTGHFFCKFFLLRLKHLCNYKVESWFVLVNWILFTIFALPKGGKVSDELLLGDEIGDC